MNLNFLWIWIWHFLNKIIIYHLIILYSQFSFPKDQIRAEVLNILAAVTKSKAVSWAGAVYILSCGGTTAASTASHRGEDPVPSKNRGLEARPTDSISSESERAGVTALVIHHVKAIVAGFAHSRIIIDALSAVFNSAVLIFEAEAVRKDDSIRREAIIDALAAAEEEAIQALGTFRFAILRETAQITIRDLRRTISFSILVYEVESFALLVIRAAAALRHAWGVTRAVEAFSSADVLAGSHGEGFEVADVSHSV